jgi:hypothetical protein
MSRERIPLAEIVSILDDAESRQRSAIEFAEKYYGLPLGPSDPRVREARALKAAADVFRIMASYEDKSRAFVAQLIKDYAEGRWP